MREGEPPRSEETPAGARVAGDTQQDGAPTRGPRGAESPKPEAHVAPPAGGDVPTRGTPAGTSNAGDMPKVLTPSRYLAWLYSTDAQKPLLAALLELESEIASGLRGDIDHHVAHARVQWWGEEVERSAEGRPVHPLTRELVRVRANVGGHAGRVASVADAALAASVASATNATPAASAAIGAMPPAASPALAGIAGFVDTAVWDLASATFETRKELTAYCERWATAMFETAPAGSAASHWKTLGAAVREIELLTDAARDAHAGRVRVPLDELDRLGVEPNALAKLPWLAPVAALLKERHEALRATVATSLAALPRDEQATLRGLLVWATLASRLSERAQRALPNAILPRRYDSLADGWQAWRAARRAAVGKFQLG